VIQFAYSCCLAWSCLYLGWLKGGTCLWLLIWLDYRLWVMLDDMSDPVTVPLTMLPLLELRLLVSESSEIIWRCFCWGASWNCLTYWAWTCCWGSYVFLTTWVVDVIP